MSRPLQHAVAADHVFDGSTMHERGAVVIDGACIAWVGPANELARAMAVRKLPEGAWLAPGFVDLQVNGGGDVLFNDDPTPEALSIIAAAHRKFGTTALLPTLITDRPEKMRTALAAVQAAMDTQPSVFGIHLEGPFLSPDRPGVHAPAFMRAPTPEDERLLTAPRRGALLLTLAPERVPAGFVGRLAARGVHVALGHSTANYQETRAAMAEGLRGFTHLFNAMPPLQARAPGPIAAALESREAWYGLIADGVHVHPAMLRLALRGAGTPVLVTDAMPPVGGRRGNFKLYGQEIVVDGAHCARSDGTLAGSVLDMAGAVGNCVRLLDLPLQTALRLASTHPAQAIGLGQMLGRLAVGARADMVAFEPDGIRVLETWVAGRAADESL
jgi:N-acetylglucosamine-6-phosphate deacetylase